LPDGALPLLASQAVQSEALSLMQGAFARRTGWAAEWLRWRLAAMLAIAALVLHLGVRGYDLIRLNAEQQRLDAAIEQAARIALPDVERIDDARAQVTQRLGGGGTADAGGLLTQLAAVGGAIAASPGPTLESLGWRDRALELQMIAPSTEAVARFAQAINARGLSADVASTNAGEDGIQAQVLIKSGPTS
jgi:general secretion pathway protein L